MVSSIGGCNAGGIRGLLDLIREHREAIRYDLFTLGRSLDGLGVDYSWADFAAFIRHLPADSQLSIEVNGAPPWSNTEVLLALTVDTLRGANWQRGGGKGPKPKPIKIPGSKAAGKKYGAGTDVESVRAYLERINGRAPEVR